MQATSWGKELEEKAGEADRRAKETLLFLEAARRSEEDAKLAAAAVGVINPGTKNIANLIGNAELVRGIDSSYTTQPWQPGYDAGLTRRSTQQLSRLNTPLSEGILNLNQTGLKRAAGPASHIKQVGRVGLGIILQRLVEGSVGKTVTVRNIIPGGPASRDGQFSSPSQQSSNV